uniref:Retrovirus-related Pol polyprotein from transposon 17.6 n=2 Tax=Lygus hesperus TaxID=30085 RepID=A0A0A9X844_LYGHE
MTLHGRPISELPYITLPNLNYKILIDTGSSVSFINPAVAEKHFSIKTDSDAFWVKTVHGTSLAGSSTIVPCEELFNRKGLRLKFYSFAFHPRFDLLLGLENLKIVGASIDLGDSILRTPTIEIPLQYLNLEVNETHNIDSRCVQQVTLKVANVEKGDAIFPYQRIGSIEIPECLIHVENFETNVRVLNSDENPTKFTQNIPVSVEEINLNSDPQISEPNFNHFDRSKYKFDLGQLRLDHMNEEEKTAISQLVTKYSDIFHQEGTPLSFTNNVKHIIRTTDEIPVYAKNYRFPEVHLEELDKQMEELLQQGIVRNSESPWNAPIWIVPKKKDSSGKQKFRVVVDYRKLNSKTIEDKYPLPQVSELLDKLGRCQYFSTIDLKSGFHQIEMDPESIAKTAFSTPTRHLEWTRVPFGLRNAPSTFQRVMDNILRGIANEYCCVYLDDIIVFSTSLQEHINRLEAVFKRLRAANLKIQLDKTDFLRREVGYLGHIVTPDGVKPNPDKIKAVQNYPIPKTTKEIKGFLGLLGYYRKFINNFAQLTKPLTKCLKKDAVINHNDPEYQNCFETCKTLLCNDPILQYPDFSKPFHLTTDASNVALGAVLSQTTNGADLPIAYASRTLNDSEQKYSPIEKELLAIVYAVGYFRPYLFGKNLKSLATTARFSGFFHIKSPAQDCLLGKPNSRLTISKFFTKREL